MRTLDFSAVEFQCDPWPLYAHLRVNDPVHWSAPNHCFVLVKHRHVRDALERKDFSVEHPFRATRQVFGPTLLDLDGACHHGVRNQLVSQFKKSVVAANAARLIESAAGELVDRLSDLGIADFVTEFAVQLPIRVIARVLGLPENDCHHLYNALRPIVTYVDNPRAGLAEAVLAKRELEVDLAELLGRHPVAEGTAIHQLTTTRPGEPQPDPNAVLRTTLLLLFAGTETMSAAISNTFVCLLKHPAVMSAARDDPSILPSLIRESLRWEPPLQIIPRFAVTDIDLDGVTIRRGTSVLLSLASANRDEEHYRSPDLWDPSRPERDLLSFGAGRHVCLGSAMAEKELEVAFRLLLERFDRFEVEGELPPIQGRVFRRPPSLPLRFHSRKPAGRHAALISSGV